MTIACQLCSEYAIRIQANQVGLKLNSTCQLLVCAGDANLLGKNISLEEKQRIFLIARKDIV